MSRRLPVVLVNGQLSEIPTGDVLSVPVNIATASYALSSLTADYALLASNATAATTSSYAYTSSAVVGNNTKTIWLPAGALISNTSSGSTYTSAELSADRLMHSYMSFDAAIPQTAQFSLSMPKSWDLGTLNGRFIWSTAVTGSTGSVVWAVEAGAVHHNGNMNITFGPTQSMVVSTQMGDAYTSSYYMYTSSLFTSLQVTGSPVSEDTVYVKVMRDATHGSDTLPVAAALVGLKLLINTSTYNDL
jgi:hypothetical protein